jgi:hypothetical protein
MSTARRSDVGPRAVVSPSWSSSMIPVAVSATMAAVVVAIGWRGSDLPAQIYRVDELRQRGFGIWDPQWYGGHATLNYSVLAPAMGVVVGPLLLNAACGVASAAVVDRILRRQFGAAGRAGSLLFAIGTVTNLMVGRTTFGVGGTFALLAVATLPRRPRWSVGLAVLSALASPVAGVFVAIAGAAWALGCRERRWWGGLIAFAAVAPIAALNLAFPGAGHFPYARYQFARDLLVCVLVAVLVRRVSRTVLWGVGLYGALLSVAFFVTSPLGANASRLGQYLAAPIIASLLWPRRKALLLACAVPLAVWQWVPAIQEGTLVADEPSTQASYYDPLLQFLGTATDVGRVEIPFTYQHWESAFVASHVPLARGWERQLDLAYNPLFYDNSLDASTYRDWLSDNGVHFVALPDARLDYSSTAEGALLATPMPYLAEVWRDAHWRVFEFTDYRGLIEGSAELVQLGPSGVTVRVDAPGDVLVRVRPSRHWALDGPGCVADDGTGWIVLHGLSSGVTHMEQTLLGSPC